MTEELEYCKMYVELEDKYAQLTHAFPVDWCRNGSWLYFYWFCHHTPELSQFKHFIRIEEKAFLNDYQI